MLIRQISKFWDWAVDKDAQKLCEKCHVVFDNWHARDNWSQLTNSVSHHNIVHLEESANHGCPICRLLFNSINIEHVESLRALRSETPSFVVVEAILGGKMTYKILLCFEIGTSLEGCGKIDVFPTVGDSRKIGQISRYTDCEDIFSLAKNWLEGCQKHHHDCSVNMVKQTLPTRLLTVGKTDTDVHLSLSRDLPVESEYLTLSHCWGGKIFVTLTSENLQDFLSHVPTERLSKTFQEAIRTTRRLGYRYLWIDSLCIIQGEEQDWRYEASRMGDVYANSTLNLAAASAPDGDIGLFLERDTTGMYNCKVMASTSSKMKGLWDCTVHDLSQKLIDSNVLYSRAWVYQERLLAPRSLCFGAAELAWECRSCRACETFPESFESETTTMPGMISIGYTTDTSQTVTDEWSFIVAGYTGTKLTFSRDKLVALSGVARFFGVKHKLSYLAGLWKEYLVFQLTWFTRTHKSPSFTSYRAPSWSWASIDTPTFFPWRSIRKSDVKTFATIEEASTSFSGDPYGEVTSGSLRIKVQRPLLVEMIVTEEWPVVRSFSISGKIQIEGGIYLDSPLKNQMDSAYLIPISQGFLMDSGIQLLSGLVLNPRDPVTCSRIGYFHVVSIEEIQNFLSALRVASERGRPSFGEPTRSDADGDQLSVITII